MPPSVVIARTLRGRVVPELRRLLSRRIGRAGRRLGLSSDELAELAVRVVDDAEMEALNARFRGDSHATDVLAFPASSELDESGLGDLALNWDAVARQATSPDRTGLAREATILCVHGLVHLLGHDHVARAPARRMLRFERRALAAVGIRDQRRTHMDGRE